MPSIRFRLLTSALFALAAIARADTVTLGDGRVLEGRVEDSGDDLVISRAGGSVRIPRRLVVTIVRARPLDEEYASKASALKDGDAAGHFDLGRWCREKGLTAQAEAEFRMTIEADPDHAGAREILGYRRVDGRWMTEKELQTSRGMVLHEGKWITPAERDLAVQRSAADALRKKTEKEVRTLILAAGGSDAAKAADASARLQSFSPEERLPPMREALRSSRPGLRRFAARELGALRDAPSVQRLGAMAVRDPDDGVAQACADSLADMKVRDVFLLFVSALGDGNAAVRTRAADRLGDFPDPRAVPPLLGALRANEDARHPPVSVEETDAVLLPGGVVRTGPGGGPAVILPRVVRYGTPRDPVLDPALDRERDALLSALRRITKQDHGGTYDDWRAGLAASKSKER